MLHFSCDLCGIPLDDQRFVIQLEAYPAFDPDQLEAADLDTDHLQQVAHELEANGPSDGLMHPDACETKKLRFDMCPRCYHKFLRDPLGRDTARRMSFSKN